MAEKMKRVYTPISEDLYKEIDAERKRQCTTFAAICRERLARDSLINELRAVIRDELSKR